MCHLVKNKGKKLLGDESRDEHLELLKYVKLMVKPDFIANYLPHIVNIDDFIFAVKDLESQRGLCIELRNQPVYKSGFEEIRLINDEEFKSVLIRWKELEEGIEKMKVRTEFQLDFSVFK
jgi:hypothetical protein